jgi:uncharacterized membrane protein (DUF373 family)
MNLIDAIAESHISAVLVVGAVSVAVLREIALSSERGRAAAASVAVAIPFFLLVVSFWAVVVARVILILR